MRSGLAVLLALAWLAGGCSAPSRVAVRAPAAGAPSLDRPVAERLALAAVAARRAAYAGAGATALRGVYGDGPLAAESRRLAALAARGGAVDEQPREERVVHLSVGPGRADAVVFSAGLQRVRAAGETPRPWSAFARQSEMELGFSSGAWLVQAERDLPPQEWWK